MARYEVTARTRVGRHLTTTDRVDMALRAMSTDPGMRLQRVDELPGGEVAIVLQRRLRSGRPDRAHLLTHRTLASLGVEATTVQQIDVHRLTKRHGRTLVRSWAGPGGYDGPGPAGVREPRRPTPNLPSLRAEADLPDA